METVLSQSTSTIVSIDIDWPDDSWASFHLLPQPIDPGWRTTGRQGGFQLIWEDPDPPDVVVIELPDPEWTPLAGDVALPVGGTS